MPRVNCTPSIGSARSMIFAGEPDYPPLLALLDDAPAVLSVLGDPALLGGPGELRWSAAATPRPTVSAWQRALPLLATAPVCAAVRKTVETQRFYPWCA